MKGKQEIYDADGYRQKLQEIESYRLEIAAEKEAESAEKQRKMKTERLRLLRIFNKSRCGEENMHFVKSLIDRAAFLRAELEYIEGKLCTEGSLDFFVQGSQTMWREHPLARTHVQYTKNYRDIITKLESYGKQEDRHEDTSNPVLSLIQRNAKARSKYTE